MSSDGGPPAGLLALLGVIWLAVLVLVIAALVSAIKVPDDSMFRNGNKLVWVLVILLLPIVGPILYFAMGRPRHRSGTED